MNRKLENLEKGLEIFNEGRMPQHDDDFKLKNTVTFLIKENQELKKECSNRLKVIDSKDKDIHKLLNRIQKMQQQQNAMKDYVSDDEESEAASPTTRSPRMLG